MSDFSKAKELGIVSEYAVDFMAYDSVDGRGFNVDYQRTAKQLAQDAAITSANVGIPSALVTYIDPNIVPILFNKKGATGIFEEVKQGTWTDDFSIFPVEEVAGGVSDYSDYGNATSTEVNYEYPVRELARFQTLIKFGDLESAKATAAKISLASRKQLGAAEIIARAGNASYLYGVAGKRNYGLLNDPNLGQSISPISVGGKSTWADKQANDSATFANVVYNDVNKLVSELFANNGGNVDANSPMVLGISNTMMPYLSAPNTFGLTALAMLKQNYPNLTIVQLPELSTAQGETLYLTVPFLNGTATGNTAYADKYRLGRLVPSLSSYEQKAIGTSWGAIIRRPSLVARMVGI